MTILGSYVPTFAYSSSMWFRGSLRQRCPFSRRHKCFRAKYRSSPVWASSSASSFPLMFRTSLFSSVGIGFPAARRSFIRCFRS